MTDYNGDSEIHSDNTLNTIDPSSNSLVIRRHDLTRIIA